MFRWRLALAMVMALALVLVACGGSSDDAAVEPAVEPALVTDAPTTADPAPTTPTEAPAPTVEPPAEPTPAPVADAASDAPEDTAAYISRRAMDLWDVYNTYDLEALMTFYEANYWAEREEEIRKNIEPFKLFGASISAEETESPTEIEPGKWRVRHLGSFTLGSVDMVFIYEQFDGEWLLTYAESQ